MRTARRTGTLAVAVLSAGMSFGLASDQQPLEDVTQICARAAMRAEHEWRLPAGLLATIGIVESGRGSAPGMLPFIWPWTINAEGRGFYQPSKNAAIGMVRAMQLRGDRLIDVGCFQVDLFYHSNAFASLEAAFDPEANASAAARILSLGRMTSTGWDGAIAAYHSSVPLFGVAYLQKIRAIWPFVKARPAWIDAGTSTPAFAVLLSSQALLVRVVTPASPVQVPLTGLPRVVEFDAIGTLDGATPSVQWLRQPIETLPTDLSPANARSARDSANIGRKLSR